MNICEATKKALEENKCIREKPYKVKVKPILIKFRQLLNLN